uniref:F-box domain-containing protein n=1 Tax=Tetradesmus obliquus TaxID=3088 RepID=A0A383VSH3_TETOB|eukprot:jgi/Sobl393_1/16397/SZX67779.1
MQGHRRRSAPGKPSTQSQLLKALAQCNDTVWEGQLVPRLRAQGSLANVALSCKQLRVLCHSNAESLRFSCANTQNHQQHLEQLPSRFPACATVQYTAHQPHDVSHFGQVLPVLSRLPRLNSIDLHATTTAASSAPLMALALELLQLRLPNLRSLAVSIMGGWGDNPQPFKAIGAATRLTRLDLYSYTDVPAQLTMGNLSALSGLSSSLKALVVGVDQLVDQDELQPQALGRDLGFLSALTGLTQLMLPLPFSAVNLAAVSACSSLRNLSLTAMEDPAGFAALEDPDCRALGCLGQLTELRLPKVQGTGSSAAFLSALKQLQELQVLRVDGLLPATALPVLAGLPKLKEMGCIWGNEGEAAAQQQQRQRRASRLVPTEQQLSGLHSMGAAGHAAIPWAAFPQLLTVMQWDQWSVDNFSGICAHCTQLRELASCEWRADTTSLPPDVPAAQRVAAVKGLAKLPKLTLLHFSANDDAEIAALAAASQLQQLTLMLPDANLDTKACSPMSLSPLLLLRSLRRLELWLPGLPLTAEDARRLISSMQCIPSVTFTVMPSSKAAVLQGMEEARAANMKVPSEFDIDVNPSWTENPPAAAVGLGGAAEGFVLPQFVMPGGLAMPPMLAPGLMQM